MKKLLISLSILTLTSCSFVVDKAFDAARNKIGLESHVDHEHDKWNPLPPLELHICPPINLSANNDKDCFYLKEYCSEDESKEYYRHSVDYCECNNYAKFYPYLLK